MGDNHRKLVESVLSAFCREQIEIRAEIGQVEARNSEVFEEKLPPEPNSVDLSFGRQEKPAEIKKKAPSAEEAQQLFGGRIIDHN